MASRTEQRRALAWRKRRIIFNNDGDDLYAAAAPTPEAVLAVRTAPLVGTQVDSVFYATACSFGMFTHATRVGQLFIPEKTVARQIIAAGTDSLRMTVDFCRRSGLEIFWSLRMNDTHDGTGHSPETPSPFFPKLKAQHPELLIGSQDRRPWHGEWTAMDFAKPEVRELTFRFVEEVCRNYDVDGVELDFFRYPIFFKSVAWGGQVEPAELVVMTNLLRRIRALADEVGAQRGRPLLLGVRVPDSAGLAAAIGVDVKTWLEEGLVDVMAVGDWLCLSPWEESVALGHAHEVPVYPVLSTSDEALLLSASLPTPDAESARERGIKEGRQVFPQASIECFRARAAQALRAGADGVYLFNVFDPRLPHWRELGELRTLENRDKAYFFNPLNGAPFSATNDLLTGGERFQRIPVLSPARPVSLAGGEPFCAGLNVPEPMGRGTMVVCRVQVMGITRADDVVVELNGKPLASGRLDQDIVEYRLDPASVRNGVNNFVVSLAPGVTRTHFDDPSSAGARAEDALIWPTRWQVFHSCRRDDPVPSPESLAAIPSRLEIGGRELASATVEVPDHLLDLATLFGGVKRERVAYVFVPFEVPQEQDLFLGLGADYWMEAWLDSRPILDTTRTGNAGGPLSVYSQLVRVHVGRGSHVLAVRFISGAHSSKLALSGVDTPLLADICLLVRHA